MTALRADSPPSCYGRFLFLYRTEFLNVNSLHHFLAVGYAGLLESLTAAEFFYDAGFFKLTLELLKGAFDGFAFFYLYYNHVVTYGVDSVIIVLFSRNSGAKLRFFFNIANFLSTLF